MAGKMDIHFGINSNYGSYDRIDHEAVDYPEVEEEVANVQAMNVNPVGQIANPNGGFWSVVSDNSGLIAASTVGMVYGIYQGFDILHSPVFAHCHPSKVFLGDFFGSALVVSVPTVAMTSITAVAFGAFSRIRNFISR